MNKNNDSRTKEWLNYGDVNFWEHGRLIKRHWPDKEDEYDVLCLEDGDFNGKVIVARCYVDINDPWIDKMAVWDYTGCYPIKTEDDKMRFVIDCISYYGIHEFQPEFPNGVMGGTLLDWVCDKKKAYEWLVNQGAKKHVSKPTKKDLIA